MGRVAATGELGRAQVLPLIPPAAPGRARALAPSGPGLPTLPSSLFEPTYSVSELCGEIRTFLTEAFPSVWVAGEVNRVFESRKGHVYFELVEKGDGDRIVGKLDAVLWRTNAQRVKKILRDADQTLQEGVEIRCRGQVDFYGAGGRLQLVVQEVDPVFTLGLLARRRAETLAALEAEGLLELNRSLPFPELPLTLALITSHESAAYHDFLTTLEESGYGFRVLLIHSAVQGKDAERGIPSALATLSTAQVDCAVLIRGGGSRSDLAAFDHRAVAEAVAKAPVPVLTGLGHQTDESIADRVAHTALKTPTKVAEFLIERMLKAETAVHELTVGLSRASLDRLRDAREALGSAERGVELARLRLGTIESRLGEVARALTRTAHRRLQEEDRRRGELARRLGEASTRRLVRERKEPPQMGERIVAAARSRLRETRATLEGFVRLTRELAPERLLDRGYSLTRDASGNLLKDPARVAPGDLLTTRLQAGTVKSRVEES